MSGPEKTRHLPADPAGIAQAGALLAAGHLVAFPTETVYGLGADARSAEAVAGIYRAKGRPSSNPLIVHVADLAGAEALGVFGPAARRLADAFWPGPLTLVVPLRPEAGLAPAITAGRETVGLRVPAGPVAPALLAAAGCPVAAPSANPSGRVSPTEAAHVLDPITGLGGRIAAVLDGGPTAVGLESTIVAADGGPLRLLRPGGVPLDVLEDAAGEPIAVSQAAGPATGLATGHDDTASATARPRPAPSAEAGIAFEAPGMMESHYAPTARLRLAASAPRVGEAWLGFGPDPDGAGAAPARLNLSEAGDRAEAAHRLFACLRRLDAMLAERGAPDATIAVAPIPDTGLGRAINDRLARAAAPRR
ncbi:MAG: L-threonylcarbamoyladenylate synthase [Pseudomonadota bacterium]